MPAQNEDFWNHASRNAFTPPDSSADYDITPPTVPLPQGIADSAVKYFPPDYDGLFCQNVRTRNRTPLDSCIGGDAELDSAMRERYARRGIDLRNDVGAPYVGLDAGDSCLAHGIDAENCCFTNFSDSLVFDDIAFEAVSNSLLSPDKRQLSLKTDRIKTMLDRRDARNPRVRGHERKHFHADYLLINAVYYYAQAYKEKFPEATMREIASQTRKWYEEDGRGDLLLYAAKLAQAELECNEREFNLGYSCYEITKDFDRFFDLLSRSTFNEVRRR